MRARRTASRRSSAPTTTSRSRTRRATSRTTPGRRSQGSPRGRRRSASGRSSRPPPSACPGSSRTRPRRSTTSPAAGSSSGSAPAGWSASTAPTASRSRRRASGSRGSPSSSRSSTALWTEERVDFRGTYYTLEDAPAQPKPVQQPHPPIIVGGSGTRGTAEPAARFADEYNTPFVSPDEFAAIRAKVERACEAHRAARSASRR